LDALDPHLRWLLAMPVYAAAYAAAAFAFWLLARHRGLATAGIAYVAQAGLAGGLIGANLAQILATGAPGKAIEGGIAGGWFAVIIAKRWIGLKRPTGDLFAVALSAGEAIGRIGCFIGGCCFGKAATLAWSVHDRGAWRHPAQLYLSVTAACTLALLVWLERKRVLPENGLFYVQGMCFCAARFAVEFFRETPSPTYAGMTLVHFACLAGFAFFAYKLAASRLPKKLRHGVAAA
jgi:phosphatidylglycerol:prolipoprotein diacylglycerol transferase